MVPAAIAHVNVMPKKYERLIGDYCAREGIAVPPGFARLTPCRYVIIRTHLSPPKLIAKTWFKTADVAYYIEHFLAQSWARLCLGRFASSISKRERSWPIAVGHG